jgi:hypothetical protein
MDRDRRGLESGDSGVALHLRSLLLLSFLPTFLSLLSPLSGFLPLELDMFVVKKFSPGCPDEPRPMFSMFPARSWEVGDGAPQASLSPQWHSYFQTTL